MSEQLKPCPFCGEQIKVLNFETNQGTKWGFASCPYCCATGPETRTSYDTSENAPWHEKAVKEWNNRPTEKAARGKRGEEVLELVHYAIKEYEGTTIVEAGLIVDIINHINESYKERFHEQG